MVATKAKITCALTQSLLPVSQQSHRQASAMQHAHKRFNLNAQIDLQIIDDYFPEWVS